MQNMNMNINMNININDSLIGSALFVATFLGYSYSTHNKSKQTVSVADTEGMQAVNFHFTRQCNYDCGFCFHTAKTSYGLPLEDCKVIILKVRNSGCKKINFAGGEPFLYPAKLGEMVKYAKEVCGYESVSIISNSRHITEDWFKKYHEYLDILGVSCDSAIDEVNKKIGRGNGKHVEYIKKAAALAHKYKVIFKLNTVVNRYNFNENMIELVNTIKPIRWKIFQVLALEGENVGDNSKKDVKPFLVTDEEFQLFVKKHQQELDSHADIMKIEDNSTMHLIISLMNMGIC